MKTVSYITFLIFCALLTVSCKKQQNNTLIVHIMAEPDDMHPTNGTAALRAEINLYTQVSLLKINFKTGELIPCMVKSLPIVSKDGLNYTYEVKEELKWDDNSAMSAADVAFTTKANKCLLVNNPGLKTYWDNIKDVVIDPLNKNRFTVVMKRPYILNTWFWTDFPIMQEGYYDKQKVLSKYSNDQLCDSAFLKTKSDILQWATDFNSSKYSTDPAFFNGGGPYKITKWDKGTSMTLEKKKDHWTANCGDQWYCQANPDKIIFKVNANNASTKLEFKNNLIDASTMIGFTTYAELAKDESFTKLYETRLADTYNYIYVAMNMKPDGQKHKKLFDDILVRRAMAILTPYEQINKTLYENNNKRMIGPISALKPDFNPGLKPVQFNIEKARALLTQAGWADTDNDQVLDKVIDGQKINFEFDINFIAGQKQWEDMAKQLAESMQKASIFARLNPVDYNGFIGSAMGHDFDMSIGAWQSSAQPEDFSQLWHSSSWKSNGLNFTGFGTTETDALIDSMNRCIDEPKRIELSKQFQKIVYDEQPYIFLFAQTRRVIVSKKWANFEVYTEYPGVLLNTLKLKD